MKNIKYCAFLFGLFLSVNSFAQNKACTGKDYITDNSYFRASANGASMDITASKKKALSNARNAIVAQITSKVQNAVNQQACEEMYKKNMMALSLIAIRQEAANIKTICENSNQANQKYSTDIVVELTKDNIIKSIIAQITGDNTLKNRFDIEKFKNTLK